MGKNSEKNKVSEFHFIVYMKLASSKEAFSTVTVSLPSFVTSERMVMAAVTGGKINGRCDRRGYPECDSGNEA